MRKVPALRCFAAVSKHGWIAQGTTRARAADVRSEVGSWYIDGWARALKEGWRVRRVRIELEE